MSKDTQQPITERSHPFTENIDIFRPQDIVTQLHMCEQEIFTGWKNSRGIYNQDILETVADLTEKVTSLLQEPQDSLILLSGCGTSGRIGFITARSFNEIWKQNQEDPQSVFEYLIAGGDFAFFTSQERAEDDPHIGIDDLKKATVGKKKVLLIGITCGLSAPYVAGQIDYALDHLDIFTPVILGFNPVELSRNMPIENWNKTFLDVAQRLQVAHQDKKGFLLNPSIGPEPITGSSRMKGGSATKILLDSIFTAAIQSLKVPQISIKSIFDAYQFVQDITYSYQEEIGHVIKKGGDSLNKNGHVYYIADDTLGMFGLLDASECPPTYGSDFEDVRGFIHGGFSKLNNKEGDLSDKVPISVDYFIQERVSCLTSDDLVIFFCTDNCPSIPQSILDSKAYTTLINISTIAHKADMKINSTCNHTINIELPWEQLRLALTESFLVAMEQHLVEITCKWLLNVISTGAHVQKGKVYQNYMIDLKVSNTKLYHRAIGIIEEFAKISRDSAESALLKSIYESDDLKGRETALSIGNHIARATNKTKVVPIALIIAATQCSCVQARTIVEEYSIVRIAISKCLHGDERML